MIYKIIFFISIYLLLWQVSLKLLDFNKLKEWKYFIPWWNEYWRGENLLNQFPEIEIFLQTGAKNDHLKLDRYLFFSDLISELFTLMNKRGIKIKDKIIEIRKGISTSINYDRQILDEILNSFLQFFIISFFSWLFMLIGSSILEIPLNFYYLIIICFLQMAGLGVFIYAVHQLKIKVLGNYGAAIKELFIFHSLINCGMSLDQVQSQSNIGGGAIASVKKFQKISTRIQKLIKRLKENGLSLSSEVNELIKEVWQLFELDLAHFKKGIVVFKFLILVCFYLPSFMIYLWIIFNSLNV